MCFEAASEGLKGSLFLRLDESIGVPVCLQSEDAKLTILAVEWFVDVTVHFRTQMVEIRNLIRPSMNYRMQGCRCQPGPTLAAR